MGTQESNASPIPGAPILPQWEAFVAGQNPPRTEFLRAVTVQAWERCKDLGVDPQHLEYKFLPVSELAAKRSANEQLIHASRPYMEHLSLVLSGRPHCIALADAEGWIIELIEHPKDSFGGRQSGICLGSSWSERHIGNNGVGTALALGEPVFVYGIEHYAASFHSAHCIGVPVRVDGEIVGCLDVSVTRAGDADPTHMALAQACVASVETSLSQMVRLDTRAAHLERFAAMGALLATTLHDLRNPLNVMRGISQIGATTAKDADERAYFQKLSKLAASMEEMLSHLQDYAAPQHLVAGSPLTLIAEVLDDIESACASQRISLETSLTADAKCALQPALFRRAIHNLITNAMKAMPEGGTLRLRTAKDADTFVIEIEDTGQGIPPELGNSVFEPFVTGRSDGTGLGLYMVHQAITKEHKGRVWFDSKPDRGTTFVVELPVLGVSGTLTPLGSAVEAAS